MLCARTFFESGEGKEAKVPLKPHYLCSAAVLGSTITITIQYYQNCKTKNKSPTLRTRRECGGKQTATKHNTPKHAKHCAHANTIQLPFYGYELNLCVTTEPVDGTLAFRTVTSPKSTKTLCDTKTG